MDAVAQTTATRLRTKHRGRHPAKSFSTAFVHSAPPKRHADGNGLYLFLQPTRAPSWVQPLVNRHRRRALRLVAAPPVTLAEARKLEFANRKLPRSGCNRLRANRRAESTPTFAEAPERVFDQRPRAYFRPPALNSWPTTERYVFPRIGRPPVSVLLLPPARLRPRRSHSPTLHAPTQR